MIDTINLKRKLHDLFSDEQPIEQVSDYDIKTAGEILIPFSQEGFFKAAQKEESYFMCMATFRRFKLRVLVFMYAIIITGLMLYNAFSNQSTMLRGGQTSDANTSLARQATDPRYSAANEKKNAAIAAVEHEIKVYDEKIARYSASNEQSKVTHWTAQRSDAEFRRMEALNEFDQTAATVKTEADKTVEVGSDYIFHRMIAFALPLLVYLCSFGAERYRGPVKYLMFVCMFVLMIPNAYLIAGSIFYMFPRPEFIAPLLGNTSPIAFAMFFVVMLGEPVAYYVCSRQIRIHLASWHSVLEMVVEERNKIVALRNQIRSDLHERELSVIDTAQQVLSAREKLRTSITESSRLAVNDVKQVHIDRVAAVQEVAEAREKTDNSLIIPRAKTSTELANAIVDMEEAGTFQMLRDRGITSAEIARQNEINPATLRVELHRIRKMRQAAQNETGNPGAEVGQVIEAEEV